MSRYSQSPPRMDSREEDDTYSWQRTTRRDADQASDRSHSPSRVPYYDANDGPRVHAYKSGDAQVYIVDEGQADRGFRPPSPMGGDLDAYDEFNFLFSKSASRDEELSDLESPAVDSDSAHRESRDISVVSNAKRIYSSHYTGSAETGGFHAAKLTELFDTKGKKRSLFKWLHIHQEVMSFDDFWAEISRQIHFPELERSAMAKLRADVKKHCIKTRQNPKGARVGYMEPRYLEVPLKSFTKQLSGQEKPTGSARWICLPYFSLQKYSGLLAGSSTSVFPSQTLLQAQYSRTTEQRDMLQAVCQVAPTKTNDCFHIAQLWCIVLDNSLLVTCGTMSELDLRGELVDVKSQPSPETAGSTPGRILVKYGNAVTWSFPAVACSTWFVEEKASDNIRLMHEERIDIFNAADDILRLFFPLTFDGPTIHKYWGAVKSLLKIPQLEGEFTVSSVSASQIITTEIRTALRDMSQDVENFQNLMSYADEKERATIDLPRQFITAWLHIVSGLISALDRGNAWLAHVSKAKVLMMDGMNRIVQGISSRNLLDDSAVLPLEVLSLFSLNLLHDQVGKAEDIMDTYAQYLTLLDAEITSQPSDRSYQHRIDLVQQEMTVIKRTVAKQRYILASIKSNLPIKDGGRYLADAADDAVWRRRRGRDMYEDAPPYYPGPLPYDPVVRRRDAEYMRLDDEDAADLEAASRLSATDELGFRALFLNECIRLVEQREFDLRRHTDYADDLERAVVYGLDWTKDRQENAIYAFTIVTVVFLPLSAISSIFGMNTNDIRDMDSGQWLYWAVAIPVTLLIIVIGLWWMGELGSVLEWLSGRQTGRVSNTRYVPGVAPQRTDAAAYVVDRPAPTPEVDYPEARMADDRLPRPMAYMAEQSVPVVRRPKRRPQSVSIRY
ncbi:putative Mg2+ transporter [Metarhizium anisopliae]|nr:putative Mg2+ transporter [Metarhizium anisopliae]